MGDNVCQIVYCILGVIVVSCNAIVPACSTIIMYGYLKYRNAVRSTCLQMVGHFSSS